MALLHRATLNPTKLELLVDWLPGRPWYQGRDISDLVRVASYRFDDPAGAVGIETTLVRAGDGPVLQIPLTYRDAPLPDADGWLLGTATHSVLGQRWVYDACGDPVYATALAGAIFAGAGQAEEFFEVDGRREHRAPSMSVSSDNADHGNPGMPSAVDDDPTYIVTDSVELAVVRRLGGSTGLAGARLTGTWDGQPTPLPLAYAARH
jgi:maltokinase-like protein